MEWQKFSRTALACAAVMTLVATATLAKPPPTSTPGQASITLKNCNSALCYANNTAWTLEKTPTVQSLTLPDDSPTITWTVTATRGDTTNNFLTVNGVVTVQNTGTANATIGNIVVNLQKKVGGKWISASADVADATSGDGATTAKICSGASSEGLSLFTENPASGSLEFTDANSNTIFSLVPQVSLAPGASITLLYTATFNNTVLGLAAGAQVRAEAMVSFGNSGARGGSGSSCDNLNINGNGGLDGDEVHVRTVPCRVTNTIPSLEEGNDTVTLSDTVDDIDANGSGIDFSNFSTTIGGGSGTEDISETPDPAHQVSVEASCTPPGSGTITNTAHLDGESTSTTVQAGSFCSYTDNETSAVTVDFTRPCTAATVATDCPSIEGKTATCVLQSFSFPCVTGVGLDAPADANVACEAELPETPNVCTYGQGGYSGTGVPGQLFDNNYLTVFSGGLTIGDPTDTIPTDTKHDASWTGNATGRTALKSYLPGGGPSGALTADTSNATSVSGGALAKQTVALTLNVGFGIIDSDPSPTATTPTVDSSGFGDLDLCNLVVGNTIGSFTLTAAQATALNGTTVSEVLADANNALGGNGLPGYVGSFGDLNQLVTALNESFNTCTASAFAVAHLCVPTP